MNYHRNLPDESEAKTGGLVPTAQFVPVARDPYASIGGYYGTAAEPPTDFQFNLLEYLRIIVKRRWLILSILATFVVLAILVTLMRTPFYTSTVRLQINREVIKVVEGQNLAPVEGGSDELVEFMRTQYELLQGRTMAERVASALKLGDDADFLQPTGFSLFGFVKGLIGLGTVSGVRDGSKANSERAAAAVILANRVVRPISGSRLIDISYSDPNPYRAQKITAAFADAFIASNLDKRFQANSYAKVFLEDQLQQLKLRLEKSEKTLLDFGQNEQIVQTNEKTSIAENNLAAANVALGTLVSERIKNEQLWKQLKSANGINVPQLLTNSVIDGLRVKRNTLQTEYQQRLEVFKADYPAMRELSNQIAEIDRELATEVATLKSSYEAAYGASVSQESEMKKRIESLKQEVLDLQKRSIQYNVLKREVDTNRSLYDGLLQRFKEIDIAGGIGANNVFVVDKATQPEHPSSPVMSRALLISFALGLVTALGLAFLLEYLDDTLRTPEEAERALGYVTLGIIPKAAAGTSLEAELADPRSHLSEAYRSLCTALQLSTEKGLPKNLLITSAGPGEGKSTTALALARHFAKIGLKVLLIDADLRKPSLHTRLKLDGTSGLTNYLTGACSPPELLQATEVPNLAFMASGPLPPNAADLLGSSRMLSLLSVGLEIFDLIVVDSPPIMGLADAPLLSSAVAGTIFVVGAGQVRTKLVRAAIKRLQFSRASLLGTVLTRFDARSSYGYGYGYGYDYHGYGERHSSDPVRSSETARPQLTSLQAGN